MPPDRARRPPRVFLSYAHDTDAHGSDTHREAVRDLWILLRANGVDAQIDRVAAEQRQDWTLWMEEQVAAADHILVIASPAYKQRAGADADPGEGRGVQYEARLIRNLFYKNQSDLQRFLPVVLPGGDLVDVPDFLTPAIATVYRVSAFTIAGAETLLRVLHGLPSEVQPELGPVPDLPTRGHTLSRPAAVRGEGIGTTTPTTTAGAALPLHHRVDVAVRAGDGGLQTTVSLAGSRLGEPHTGRLPSGIERCWDNLDLPVATDRLAHLGAGLWTALFDENTTRLLLELVDTTLVGTTLDLVFHLDEPVSWLPVEILRIPTDHRLLATLAGVWITPAWPGSTGRRSGRCPGR
jgi:hypothetical protein